MSIVSRAKALFRNDWWPETSRGIAYPVTGLGAGTGLGAVLNDGAALTWGVYNDIALPALITEKKWIVAAFLDTASAIETYAVQIGTTRVTVAGVTTVYANAAAVDAVPAAAAAAWRTEIRQQYIAVLGVLGPAMFRLPVPIPLEAGDGIIARCSSIGGGVTINCSVLCYYMLEY